MKSLLQGFVLLAVYYLFCLTACVHDPLFMKDEMEIDTMPALCDSNVVNFAFEVLPILSANCALSGCHDQITEIDNVNLTSFDELVRSNIVVPYDLDESELYEVLTTNDISDRMPPQPAAKLTEQQVELIERWILEGANNVICVETNSETCVKINVSFKSHILPILDLSCRSCHSGDSPAGGIELSTHAGVQEVSLNGKLSGAIEHQIGYSAMPQGAVKLDDCKIDQINSWIADGALNN